MDPARRILREIFGYDDFRPPQEAVIGHVVRGDSGLLVMPTGGGKSLCYQIPALLRPGTALVVSPLIALMQDQVEGLRQLGVRAAFLNSSQAPADQGAVLRELRRGGLDLLYVAPERAVTPRFLEAIEGVDLALLAIDEAHCISQWGHEFRPEYRQLRLLREFRPALPCLAVTATADAPTRADICAQLDLPPEHVFLSGFDRPNLHYTVVVKREPRRQLAAFLHGHRGASGIVYCGTRRKVEQTASRLAAQGFDALPYHAGLDPAVRAAHQRRFLQEEGVVVVATVAFGMGIDKPEVRFVAHLDVPASLEAYYQESGRAGRDGEPAEAWMAFGWGDVVEQRRRIGAPEEGGMHRWVALRKLEQLLGYCETAGCRRRVLLGYFGEEPAAPCGRCDNCLDPPSTWDGTEAARKLLSCVRRTGEVFGVGHVVDVLTAQENEKIFRHGHQRLPTWGVGGEHDGRAWRSIARQLVAAGLLTVDVERYGALRLTERAWPVLRGEVPVELTEERRPPPTRRPARAAAAVDLPPEAGDLFEALRDLRRELAREQGVPAYLIFHDRTLKEMAARRPASLPELAEVPGVGAAKLARYGDRFLSRIRSA